MLLPLGIPLLMGLLPLEVLPSDLEAPLLLLPPVAIGLVCLLPPPGWMMPVALPVLVTLLDITGLFCWKGATTPVTFAL